MPMFDVERTEHYPVYVLSPTPDREPGVSEMRAEFTLAELRQIYLVDQAWWNWQNEIARRLGREPADDRNTPVIAAKHLP